MTLSARLAVSGKLGGITHYVPPEDFPGIVKGDTMILGADLGHPPFKPDSDAPTVACSIATYNDDCDAYSAQIRLQEGRADVIVNLVDMVTEHLKIFQNQNAGRVLGHILLFRDGISEGQYAAALSQKLLDKNPEMQRVAWWM
ncbi:Protein argonaute [Cryptotrichosporon argae]